MRVPLPLLLPTVLGPLSDVVSQATKFTAEHHGLYSVVHRCEVALGPSELGGLNCGYRVNRLIRSDHDIESADTHLRVYALGLVSWLASQQAAASAR